jgi:major intracellular serine protease
MGCGPSKATEKAGFRIPSVTRSPANTLRNFDGDDELPLSIILTGGRKLRDEGLDGRDVKVAVIDSGIDNEHPGFRGKVTRKIWFREGTSLKVDDHGTHVAGTVHMMAPLADIYDYRVFGETGSVGITQAISQAIRAAADDECQIINMSLGGPMSDPEIESSVQYATSMGVVIVCAAGNEGDDNPLTNEIR